MASLPARKHVGSQAKATAKILEGTAAIGTELHFRTANGTRKGQIPRAAASGALIGPLKRKRICEALEEAILENGVAEGPSRSGKEAVSEIDGSITHAATAAFIFPTAEVCKRTFAGHGKGDSAAASRTAQNSVASITAVQALV